MKTMMKTQDQETEAPFIRRICFHCGMLPGDWVDNGFETAHAMYCCRGCAEKTGCTCGREDAETVRNFSCTDFV